MARPVRDSHSALQQLAAALLEDVDRIANRSVARMQELLPSYAEVPPEDLLPVTLTNTRNLLVAVLDPQADPTRAEDHFRMSGQTRIRQGITADALLQAWRIGVESVREEAHRAADRLGIGDEALLEFVEATLQWGDVGMRQSAEAHRKSEIRELERLAAEQAGLRRVATLVAEGAPPGDVFTAVNQEVARLLPVTSAAMGRFAADGTCTTVAAWSAQAGVAFPVGDRWDCSGTHVTGMVLRTGRPARLDDFSLASGPIGIHARDAGYRSAVGSPIMIEGRLWGVMSAASLSDEPLPADAEDRLASFTELVATAIANAQARAEAKALSDEQAALRRVAELVAREATQSEVSTAIAAEIVQLLGTDEMRTMRYEGDRNAVVAAAAGARDDVFPVGSRWPLGGENVTSQVFRTRAPARLEYGPAITGPIGETLASHGIRAAVGAPILVQGQLWGAMLALSFRDELLPADTEARLSQFTKLMGTAIANAEARGELAASRARLVVAGDEARRRFERNLHDGVQQRLVSLALRLRRIERRLSDEDGELRAALSEAVQELNATTDEVREIAQGIHPAILTQGGLAPALRALALRSPVPAEVAVQDEGRLPEAVEVAAYYVAAEALTNAAKHAVASRAWVTVGACDGGLRLRVSDDGVGGADPSSGSGLTGIRDRVEALGGSLAIQSPRGRGTVLDVVLPVPDGLR